MDLSRLAANSKVRAGVSPAVMQHACKTVQHLTAESKAVQSLFLLDVAALQISQLARAAMERQIRGEWEDVKYLELVVSLLCSAAVEQVNTSPRSVDEILQSVSDIITPMLTVISAAAKTGQKHDEKASDTSPVSGDRDGAASGLGDADCGTTGDPQLQARQRGEGD